MRPQGIGLEHHTDLPLFRRNMQPVTGNRQTVQGNVPAIDRLQPGDGSQKRGLAASRRPHDHEKHAVLDRERDIVQGFVGTERPGDGGEMNGHASR
jgi:hypothetical protein